jgi:hypothetical protein
MSDKPALLCAEVQNEEINILSINTKGKLNKWVHEIVAPGTHPVETLLNKIEANFGKEGIEVPIRVILNGKSTYLSKLIFSADVDDTKSIEDWQRSMYLGDGSESYVSKTQMTEIQNSQVQSISAGLRREELKDIESHFKTWGVKPQWIDLLPVAVSNALESIEADATGVVFVLGTSEPSWYNVVNGDVVSSANFRIKTNSDIKTAVETQIEKYGFHSKAIYLTGSQSMDENLESYLQSLESSVKKINTLDGLPEAASITEKEALACSLAYSLYSRGDF